MEKKEEKWIKTRHGVLKAIAYVLMYPIARIKYGCRIERFKDQGSRAYLILYNHQTPFDQFFTGMVFHGALYYLATEDIFSNGFVSSLLRWAVAPIPIKKATSDIAAVRTCVRVAREGGSIAIAPEGNRTYSGKTEHISSSIASLAKMIKLPIAFQRIEGGYGVEPRWSDSTRKGRMRTYVSRVLEPEEYAKMGKEELTDLIRQELYVNEGNSDDGLFRSPRRAEYLERAVYVCPFCGLSEFESSGSEVKCRTCGRVIEYGEDKRLTGKGFDFPFAYMTEWYDYQCDFVNGLDLNALTEAPVFTDEAELSEVFVGKKKEVLRPAAVFRLYGDRVTVDEDAPDALILPFEEVTAAAALGRNKLNLYHGQKVYQVRGSKRFNALKYVNFYYRSQNIRGNKDGKFLGL